MGGTYFLMNKDRRVLTLQSEATFGFTAFRIIERHGGCLPYGFTSPDEWIERRQVAKHRAQLRRLMRAWGLDDRPGFIDFTHCASLMDAFWMKRADSPLTWKDVSLYRNPFNDTVADLAYDGAGDCGRRLDLPTPELATPGSFEKCWRRTDAGIFQYKRGRKGALSVAAAPHSEKLTCDLLRAMGINHVPYALTVYRDAIASCCPIFTTEDEGFITFAAYAGKRVGEPQEIMDIIGNVADEDRFREMVVADAISLNVDRHQGNYGFTVDNATGEITGFAPLFDHNLSQLPGLAPSDDVDDLPRRRGAAHRGRLRPHGAGRHDATAQIHAGQPQKLRLRKPGVWLPRLEDKDAEPAQGPPHRPDPRPEHVIRHIVQLD